MIRTLLIAPFLFFSVNTVNSQSFIEIYGGFNFGSFKNSSFNQFANSYNENTRLYAGSTLVKDFEPLKTSRGFNFGVSLFPVEDMPIGISYNIMHLRALSTAEFTYGKRHVEQVIVCPMNIGFPIKAGPITIHPKMGVTHSNFNSYFEYSDGTISYNGEKSLNGHYHGFGFIGDLSIEWDVIPDDFPFTLSVGGSATTCKAIFQNSEESYARVSSGNGAYPSGLPLDYPQLNSTGPLDYKGGWADGRFVSFTLFVNAKIKIGK